MNRLRYKGPVSRAVVTTVLAVALGIAASIALAHSGGGGGARTPSVSIRFPDAHRWYGNRRWFAGCRNGIGLGSARCVPFHCKRYRCRAGRGVRGVAFDRRGITAVLVSVRRDRDRRYRRNGAFSSRRAHYVRATLSGHGRRVRWFRWLGLPRRDGRYTVRALLIGRGGDAADPVATATVTFAADHRRPPKPRLHVRVTGARSVTLRFSSRRRHMTFRCRLDRRPWRRCRSPLRYSRLSLGRHVFAVRSVDRYGRYGRVTRRRWRTAARGGARVTIRGRPTGLLYPAGASLRVPLRVANPSGATITVTGLWVRMRTASLPGGCDPAGFRIAQSNISAANPIRLGPYRAVTLPSGRVSAPAIRMIDTHANQDACEGGRLALTYTGRAHR